MSRKTTAVSVALCGGLLLAAGNAVAENVQITLEPYVTGVNAPVAMVQPPGDDRKFVVEHFGRVRIIDAGRASCWRSPSSTSGA